MKIRTDFVTNSSSSNYVTINIKSPKLTEIVRAAKIHKESEESDFDDWDETDKLQVDESEQTVKLALEIGYILNRILVDWGAHLQEIRIGRPPENSDDFFNKFLNLWDEVGGYPFREYDFAGLREALEKNRADIIADMESVDWIYKAEGHGEANIYPWFWDLKDYVAEKEHLDYGPSSLRIQSSFHYDKENGESHKEEFSYYKPQQRDSADDDLGDDDMIEDYGDDEDWEDDKGFDGNLGYKEIEFDEDDLDFGDDDWEAPDGDW